MFLCESTIFDLDVRSNFTLEEKQALFNVPSHIAIIMDGNRRWGKMQGKHRDPLSGHAAGVNSLFRIVLAAAELGVKQLTAFGFSTENWKRSTYEIKLLTQLIGSALSFYRSKMIEYGIKLSFIGDLSPFPKDLQSQLQQTSEATHQGARIELTLALNYGGRNELVRATKTMMRAVQQGELSLDRICEEIFERYLDTAHMADPDLIIRTSGENRLSNFLLWQSAYAEFYTTEVLWPNFTPHNLLDACISYQGRRRRRGK